MIPTFHLVLFEMGWPNRGLFSLHPPPYLSAHLPSFNCNRSCYQTALLMMRRKSVVNSVKWFLFVITNLSFWLSCHSISSSCCTINLPRKLRQKQINRQIFFYLMKLSPFFPNIPLIHSLCHIHFAHLYVLHELSLHCMLFTSFILCGHTQLSQIVFLSLHTTGILYVKCFFFLFFFSKLFLSFTLAVLSEKLSF